MDDKATEVETCISSVLTSNPLRMTIRDLERQFREIIGCRIPYRELGFYNLESYLRSLSHRVVVNGQGYDAEVRLVVSEKTAHIDDLIRKQRSSKKRTYQTPRKRPSFHNNSYTSYNSPQQNNPKPPNTPSLNVSNNNEVKQKLTTEAVTLRRPHRDDNTSHHHIKPNLPPRLQFQNNTQYSPRKEEPATNVQNTPCGSTSLTCRGATPKKNKNQGLIVPIYIQNRLTEIISKHPEGLLCNKLPELYKNQFKQDLNFFDYGCKSVAQFCMELNTIFDHQRLKDGSFKVFDKSLNLRIQDEPLEEQIPWSIETTCRNSEPALPDGVEELLMDFHSKHLPSDVVTDVVIFRQWIGTDVGLGDFIELDVAQVHDPSKFWIQLREHIDELNRLMDDMQIFYRNYKDDYTIPYYAIRIDMYVASLFEGEYHRAKVVDDTKKKEGQVKVFYIDYGTVAVVLVKGIYYLKTDFVKLPAQAIRARLYGIKPTIKDDLWPSSASARFYNLVSNKELVGQIYDIDEEEMILDLIITDTTHPGRDIFINDLLIKENLAAFAHEELSEPPSVVCKPTVPNVYLYPKHEELENYLVPTYQAMLYFEVSNISYDKILPQYFKRIEDSKEIKKSHNETNLNEENVFLNDNHSVVSDEDEVSSQIVENNTEIIESSLEKENPQIIESYPENVTPPITFNTNMMPTVLRPSLNKDEIISNNQEVIENYSENVTNIPQIPFNNVEVNSRVLRYPPNLENYTQTVENNLQINETNSENIACTPPLAREMPEKTPRVLGPPPGFPPKNKFYRSSPVMLANAMYHANLATNRAVLNTLIQANNSNQYYHLPFPNAMPYPYIPNYSPFPPDPRYQQYPPMTPLNYKQSFNVYNINNGQPPEPRSTNFNYVVDNNQQVNTNIPLNYPRNQYEQLSLNPEHTYVPSFNNPHLTQNQTSFVHVNHNQRVLHYLGDHNLNSNEIQIKPTENQTEININNEPASNVNEIKTFKTEQEQNEISLPTDVSNLKRTKSKSHKVKIDRKDKKLKKSALIRVNLVNCKTTDQLENKEAFKESNVTKSKPQSFSDDDKNINEIEVAKQNNVQNETIIKKEDEVNIEKIEVEMKTETNDQNNFKESNITKSKPQCFGDGKNINEVEITEQNNDQNETIIKKDDVKNVEKTDVEVKTETNDQSNFDDEIKEAIKTLTNLLSHKEDKLDDKSECKSIKTIIEVLNRKETEIKAQTEKERKSKTSDNYLTEIETSEDDKIEIETKIDFKSDLNDKFEMSIKEKCHNIEETNITGNKIEDLTEIQRQDIENHASKTNFKVESENDNEIKEIKVENPEVEIKIGNTSEDLTQIEEKYIEDHESKTNFKVESENDNEIKEIKVKNPEVEIKIWNTSEDLTQIEEKYIEDHESKNNFKVESENENENELKETKIENPEIEIEVKNIVENNTENSLEMGKEIINILLNKIENEEKTEVKDNIKKIVDDLLVKTFIIYEANIQQTNLEIKNGLEIEKESNINVVTETTNNEFEIDTKTENTLQTPIPNEMDELEDGLKTLSSDNFSDDMIPKYPEYPTESNNDNLNENNSNNFEEDNTDCCNNSNDQSFNDHESLTHDQEEEISTCQNETEKSLEDDLQLTSQLTDSLGEVQKNQFELEESSQDISKTDDSDEIKVKLLRLNSFSLHVITTNDDEYLILQELYQNIFSSFSIELIRRTIATAPVLIDIDDITLEEMPLPLKEALICNKIICKSDTKVDIVPIAQIRQVIKALYGNVPPLICNEFIKELDFFV